MARGPGDYTTSNKADFVPQTGERAAPIKHASQPLPGGKMEGNSTYKQEYPVVAADRAKPIKPQAALGKNDAPMEFGTTSVNTDFLVFLLLLLLLLLFAVFFVVVISIVVVVVVLLFSVYLSQIYHTPLQGRRL